MSTAASSDEIVFYDLCCAEPAQCWSPHCWKTRLVLQYKQVPFRTVWVSYPDIKSVVGHTQPDAEAPTLPVIQHGSTWVSDSWSILLYLEAHFPPAPGTGPLLHPSPESVFFFQSYVESILVPSGGRVILPKVAAFLDDKGREYFVRTRSEQFGCPLEEVGKGETVFQFRQPLGPVVKTLTKFGPYLGGKQLSYMDIILLGVLQWFDRADHAAVVSILGMHTDTEGKQPLQEWYDLMVPLAVTQVEEVQR